MKKKQIEIIFPVASEAMTATGEAGEGSMQVVPGVSGRRFFLLLHKM